VLGEAWFLTIHPIRSPVSSKNMVLRGLRKSVTRGRAGDEEFKTIPIPGNEPRATAKKCETCVGRLPSRQRVVKMRQRVGRAKKGGQDRWTKEERAAEWLEMDKTQPFRKDRKGGQWQALGGRWELNHMLIDYYYS